MRSSSRIERKKYTYTTSCEEQTLQIRELVRGNGEHSSCTVENSPGSGLVLVECISGKKDEGRSWDDRVNSQDLLERFLLTSVNNTGSGGKDVGRAVADRLVDSPESVSWGGTGDWATCVYQYRRLH